MEQTKTFKRKSELCLGGYSDDCSSIAVRNQKFATENEGAYKRAYVTLPSGELIMAEVDYDGSWETSIFLPAGCTIRLEEDVHDD